MYLNTIYYGNGAYGIEAASIIYFNKDASDLTLAEAATLIGLPQSPSYYDPTVNPDAAKTRRNTVLDRMDRRKACLVLLDALFAHRHDHVRRILVLLEVAARERLAREGPHTRRCEALLLASLAGGLREDLLGRLLKLGTDGLGVRARGSLGEQVCLDLGLGTRGAEDDLVIVLETKLDDVGGRQNLCRLLLKAGDARHLGTDGVVGHGP